MRHRTPPQRCFNLNKTTNKETKAPKEETFCFAETNISNAKFYSVLPAYVGQKNSLCCEEGFTGFGQSSLTCQPNGSFTPTDFRCLKNCAYPPKETTTMKLLSWSPYRFVENTTALYQCHEGFYNLTLPQIVCDTKEKWSKYECLPACDYNNAPQILHGFIVQTKNRWYTVNDTTQNTCEDGFYLSPGSPVISCNIQGQLVVPNIRCYRYCTSALDYGYSKNPTHKYKADEILYYGCQSGYYKKPYGESKCGVNGEWSIKPECYKHCGDPPLNAWGEIKIHGQAPYTISSSYTFDCNLFLGLHSRDGIDRNNCQPNGQWTDMIGCCTSGLQYCGGGHVCGYFC